MEVLAKRLKWLREKHRYSQKEIGDKIGMTVSGFQKIEYSSREPKLDVLVELAKLFNVSTDFLLGLTDETEELNNLTFKAKSLFIQKTKIEKEAQELTLRMNFLQEEVMQLENMMKEMYIKLENKSQLNEDEIDNLNMNMLKIDNKKEMIRTRMYEYEKEYDQINRSNFEVSKEYSYCVLEYIKLMLEIPDSKANNSTFLQKHIPISTGIQQTLFDTYSISVSGHNINAYMGEYETIEELELQKARIDEFLKVE